MQITLDMPIPPSTNRLWRSGRKNGKTFVYQSSTYKLWITQADVLFLQQKKGPIKMLRGPFKMTLHLLRPSNNTRMDIDNRIKAALDYAVRLGLIEDDSYLQYGEFGWGTRDQAPHGCRLTLTSLDE